MRSYDLTEADFEEEMTMLLAGGPGKYDNQRTKQLWLVFQAGKVRFRAQGTRPPRAKGLWDTTEHLTFDEARKAYNEL